MHADHLVDQIHDLCSMNERLHFHFHFNASNNHTPIWFSSTTKSLALSWYSHIPCSSNEHTSLSPVARSVGFNGSLRAQFLCDVHSRVSGAGDPYRSGAMGPLIRDESRGVLDSVAPWVHVRGSDSLSHVVLLFLLVLLIWPRISGQCCGTWSASSCLQTSHTSFELSTLSSLHLSLISHARKDRSSVPHAGNVIWINEVR